MTDSKAPLWTAPPHPEWLSQLNTEGSHLNLRTVVPLDARSLLDHARADTGLEDFGDELWREPFEVLLNLRA